ncbi:hypothetical protein F5Y16DRAFT_402762 [Xylariaceae sp. FL0255]|nr:hypothetical protein F5Y16DRAFT_402762 [Xylariaceae sp. FL0255]
MAFTGLSFVFRLPLNHPEDQSLRQRLLNGPAGQHDSLSGRLDLAQQLAQAVTYVHLYESAQQTSLPSKGTSNDETAVLVGFDVLRGAEGKTLRLGDDHWEKNLYRRPERQGKSLATDYEMRHDIYSLGVCLLEIGLWEGFVDYEKSLTDIADMAAQNSAGIGSRY